MALRHAWESILGIDRTTLLSRMKKFAIYAKQFS